MVEFLFLDLDDTILDFHKAEAIALSKTLTDFGISPTEENLRTYSAINKAHWERLERREITRSELQVSRFVTFLAVIGADAPAKPWPVPMRKTSPMATTFFPVQKKPWTPSGAVTGCSC